MWSFDAFTSLERSGKLQLVYRKDLNLHSPSLRKTLHVYHLSPTSMVCFKWTFLCRKLSQKLIPCLIPKLIQPGIIHGLKDGKWSYPSALNPSKCIRTMESSAFVQYLAPSETLCVSGHFCLSGPELVGEPLQPLCISGLQSKVGEFLDIFSNGELQR